MLWFELHRYMKADNVIISISSMKAVYLWLNVKQIIELTLMENTRVTNRRRVGDQLDEKYHAHPQV